MVRVDRFDERRHLRGPLCDSRGGTGTGRGSAVHSISAHTRDTRVTESVPSGTPTPRFIGQLPGQNARLVKVTRDEGLDIVFVRSLRRVSARRLDQCKT